MSELGEAVDVGRTDSRNRRLERADFQAGLGEQLGDNVEMFHAWGWGHRRRVQLRAAEDKPEFLPRIFAISVRLCRNEK